MRRLLMVVSACAAVWAQEPTPAAKELSALMDKASEASARGDVATALKLADTALATTKKDPALKGRVNELMRAKGRIYFNAKQYPNAVRVYGDLLDSMKGQCIAGTPTAEICTEVYYDMGTAQMYTQDWAGAAATLRKGIPLYEAMSQAPSRADFKMAKLKLEANTESMLAAALFRAGDLNGSIATYEKAIRHYKIVADNPESGDGLRMLAKQSMANEQQSLNMIKQEAKLRASQQNQTPKK